METKTTYVVQMNESSGWIDMTTENVTFSECRRLAKHSFRQIWTEAEFRVVKRTTTVSEEVVPE